jgi:poly(A) polymerase
LTSPVDSGIGPRVIPRAEHTISRADISRNAVKVLYRLKDAGYQACIVGGGVRDLLLGRQPKDFDVATDASPEQVRELFGNCQLIGRRFRLAHVRFRDEIIEVATFRGVGGEDLESEDRHVLDEAGRIIKDNAYGSIEEDAWRRDFTINALYYNIADFSILDYVDGMADIAARRLRLIGDPETRFREDPVRMVRAARLAAKLDLEIDAATAAAMPRLAPLLDSVPAARLFDEFLKVFETGHALEGYRRLQAHGLFEHLFPATGAWLAADDAGGRRNAFIERALANTDARVAAGLPVTPMFLFGVFLWGPVTGRARELAAEGLGEAQALVQAGFEVTTTQVRRVALPKRFSIPMREMFHLQPRFARRQGRRVQVTLQHRRFRAAFDLYLLREVLGEADPAAIRFWTDIQSVGPAVVQAPSAEPASGEDQGEVNGGEAPPRRRRRRSRSRGRSGRRAPEPAPAT